MSTMTTALISLRLTPADKARIARAVALRGVSVSAFVRDAALREAERVLASKSKAKPR